MRFLTCEPNLKGEENYLDEADVFEKNPLTWLQQEYYNQHPTFQESLFISQDGLRNLGEESRGSRNAANERKETKWEVELSSVEEEMGNQRKREIGDQTADVIKSKMEKTEFHDERQFDGREALRGDFLIDSNGNEEQETVLEGNKERRYKSEVEKDPVKNIERETEILKDRNVRERKYDITETSLHNLPSHIVMFSVMEDKVKEFLTHHHYYLCHKIFHSHINDGRRSQHIHIYCNQATPLRT